MTDERPRPQYGEYATPEQQAVAMGKKYVPPAPEPIAPPPTNLPGNPLHPDAEHPADHVSAGIYPRRQAGYANRFLTVLMLALGGLNLLTDVPGYLNLTSAFKAFMKAYGTTGVAVPASINGAGIPVIIANVVLYGLTVFLSVLALRRGRVAVYIPILGFVVFALVVGILISIYAPGYLTELQN
jgi:hypothetical protein